uniref:Uncharacterized protein n=1 Tax=Rhodnius prolixus TaxID=13249 RepID=T1HYH4_RHOPR
MLWRSQQIQYQEPPIPISPPIAKAVRSRSQDDSMKSSAQNGTDLKPVYKSSPSTPAPVVRFRIPSEEPPRENGIPLEKLNLEDEERTKLLKPQPVTLGDKEVCELSGSKPNLDVLSLTINEDDIGEREEEREMMQSRLRPHSLVDFGNAEKTVCCCTLLIENFFSIKTKTK